MFIEVIKMFIEVIKIFIEVIIVLAVSLLLSILFY